MPPIVDVTTAHARARGWLDVGTQPRRRVLGVVGPPGVGKSTFAAWLVGSLTAASAGPPAAPAASAVPAATVLPMDGFHLAGSELERLGSADRKGAPDTFDVAGLAAILRRVRRGEPVLAPRFDRSLEEPIAGALHIDARTPLVVVEGNYLLSTSGAWADLRPLLDEVWYLHVDDAQRRTRLVDRHVRYGRTPGEAERWVATVDEPNAALIAACRPLADLVVVLDGWEGAR